MKTSLGISVLLGLGITFVGIQTESVAQADQYISQLISCSSFEAIRPKPAGSKVICRDANGTIKAFKWVRKGSRLMREEIFTSPHHHIPGTINRVGESWR